MVSVVIPGRIVYATDPLDFEKGVIFVNDQGDVGVYANGVAVRGSVADIADGSAEAVAMEHEAEAVPEAVAYAPEDDPDFDGD